MNLRRKKPHDSLYMLLDTMCNAFGGIILLAVMVVLLTNQERSPAATANAREMLRRLDLAQTSLRQSRELAASLQARANDTNWKQQAILLSTRKELQTALQQTRDAVARDTGELDSAAAADPSTRVKFLNAEFAEAETRRLAAQNRLAADIGAVKQLKERLAALERQVSVKLSDLQRPLRLPREHETGKRVVYVIAQFGRIYPCRNADLGRNETDIAWTPKAGGETANPIRGRGFDAAGNLRGLEDYFRSQSGESVYIAFCVFDDSFPAFIRAKQLVVASGVAYGWEPFRTADGPVAFSARGFTPKPQ